MKENQGTLKPYFEKQKTFSMLCGLHAVNNFLGINAYNKDQFNNICKELSTITNQSYQLPILGGDYDVSVLIKALNDKNFSVEWHDTRKEFKKETLGDTQFEKLQGFLINIKLQYQFYRKFLGLSGRHWISIKFLSSKNSNITIKFDSTLKEPIQLGFDNLFQYLEDERKKGAQIIKILKKQSMN